MWECRVGVPTWRSTVVPQERKFRTLAWVCVVICLYAHMHGLYISVGFICAPPPPSLNFQQKKLLSGFSVHS